MRYRANDLSSHWIPFTSNRDFKANPRLIAKAEGVWYYDAAGRKLLDGSSGLFNVPLGHGRQDIADAVRNQLLESDYVPSFQLGHPASFDFAELLTHHLGAPFGQVFFTNSGSEAIDTAIKIVQAYHRARGEGHRVRLVSRERAYHGVNIGGTSLSGMVRNRETFSMVLPHVSLIRNTVQPDRPFVWGQDPEGGVELANDLERLVQTYGGGTIAACFVEPVAGSTGVLVPPRGYLERLREICTANGILLIFDEVICGFGRLGSAFGMNAFGVEPDIVTMAKALTNGCVPMGAVGVQSHIYETVTQAAPERVIEFFHGYTYSAHPVACAAGLTALTVYERDNLYERAAALSPDFAAGVQSLRDIPVVKDIRGMGLLAGVEVEPDGAPGARGTQLQKDLFKAGLVVKVTGDVAILSPPFVATPEQIDHMIEVLAGVLKKI